MYVRKSQLIGKLMNLGMISLGEDELVAPEGGKEPAGRPQGGLPLPWEPPGSGGSQAVLPPPLQPRTAWDLSSSLIFREGEHIAQWVIS